MTNSPKLSQSDIEKLLSEPNEKTKIELTEKVSSYYNSDDIDQKQKTIIDDIFRAVSKDISAAVREMLAQNVKSNPHLPKDIAQNMINDIDSIALPVLQESQIFTDEEFIEIIKNVSPNKQSAIATRENVSETLCQALIETNHEQVVSNLVKNDGAQLSDTQFTTVLDKFENSPAVQKAFIKRSIIPQTATERLISKMSDQLQNELKKKHTQFSKNIEESFEQGREQATATFTANYTNHRKTRELVQQIHSKNRLTSSLVLRMLCMGDIFFVEESFSQLANIPITNARILIHDGGEAAFESIYQKANLDPKLLPAFKVALEVYTELEINTAEDALITYRRTMIERVLTQYEDMGEENLNYLLGKFSDLAEQAA